MATSPKKVKKKKKKNKEPQLGVLKEKEEAPLGCNTFAMKAKVFLAQYLLCLENNSDL